MKPSESMWESLSIASLNTYDLNGLDMNMRDAQLAVKQEIMCDFEEVNSLNTLAYRFEHFKIPNTSLDDYKDRYYSLSSDKGFLCGVRHYGGDKDLPFLMITPNFLIEVQFKVYELYKLVETDFAKFKPLQISYWTSKIIDADQIGNVYMVAKADYILETPPWGQEKAISFIDITDDKYYVWYLQLYQEEAKLRPELSKSVQANDIETMNESLKQNLLKYICIDNKKVGLIAAVNSNFLGHQGLYFNEIVLTKDYRNKGLAKAVQRLFIKDYTNKDDYIWGTINSENFSSLLTARSNARVAIRFECFTNI
ncbi:MAG: hypothetical protein KC646_11345 [Candidatus Cloacimonetes bacterium]|nr:hypothetical protein [Candidatus Cloacimonadota bacterium]